MEQLSFLFNEAEVFAEVSTKQEEAVVAAHKRHKKHEYTLDNIPEGIPTKQVEHRLEGEELGVYCRREESGCRLAIKKADGKAAVLAAVKLR